jgi:GNAT superfamily N-acetyltransferase
MRAPGLKKAGRREAREAALARRRGGRTREISAGSDAFRISSEPGATSVEIATVREGLHRFNFDATGRTRQHEVTLLVRDAEGAIKGGLLGYVWAEWLHVTELWLAEECRRRGLGGRLLQRAERVASLVGARGAFLSTFDFQAPEFYSKHGYEIFATLPGYPPGHAEHHLRKLFDA